MKWRLVDKITGWEKDRRITGVKSVSFEEYCLKSAFSAKPWLPESMLLEAPIELARWLALLSSGFTRSFLPEEIESAIFHNLLCPGETLRIDLSAIENGSDHLVFDCVGTAGEKPVLTVRGVRGKLLAAAELHSTEDLKVLFSEIGPPGGSQERAEGSHDWTRKK